MSAVYACSRQKHHLMYYPSFAGVAAALETFKAEKAYPMRKIHEILPDIIGRSSKLFHNKEAAAQTLTDLKAFQKADYYGKVKNLSNLTDVLRWVKSPVELKLMRESASIACQALLHTMMYSKTRPYEGMLAAKFEYECKMRGAQRMAFNPVVGGGSNATVIHYSRNDQKIEDGDLVLMDVGCELHGYVSDLTRTWAACAKVYSSAKQLEGETKQPRQQAQTAKPTKTRKTQKGNITRSPPKPKAKQQNTQKPGDYIKTPAAQTQNTTA
ncbi:hypothetical protein Q3G72_006089 [Acer saccharum]|nr:hypothetical protein Q3G72_006089 [Acer saccharum]